MRIREYNKTSDMETPFIDVYSRLRHVYAEVHFHRLFDHFPQCFQLTFLEGCQRIKLRSTPTFNELHIIRVEKFSKKLLKLVMFTHFSGFWSATLFFILLIILVYVFITYL